MTATKRVTIIGLTGNICSGKTTILKIFESMDCKVISADQIVHDLIEKDDWVRKKITATFGPNVLAKNHNTSRTRLADIVFENKEKLRMLEGILHPEIENAVSHEINLQPRGATIVIETPLLFETNWHKKLDHTIFVKCPKETRKDRYYEDPCHKQGDFERRETLLLSEDEKVNMADYIIDNSQDVESSKKQIEKILSEIKEK